VAALEESANRILARHEALRTRFCFDHALPVPEVLQEAVVHIPIVDLKKFHQTKQEPEARRLAEAEVLKPFNLTQAPLLSS
jgi:hypothetical protein